MTDMEPVFSLPRRRLARLMLGVLLIATLLTAAAIGDGSATARPPHHPAQPSPGTETMV
ncbi:MAG: hypothetical protein OHK0024_18170 [Thalassobaculales bacterium]